MAIKVLRWRVLTAQAGANVNVLEMATPLLKLLVTVLEHEGLAKPDVLERYAFSDFRSPLKLWNGQLTVS